MDYIGPNIVHETEKQACLMLNSLPWMGTCAHGKPLHVATNSSNRLLQEDICVLINIVSC
jgi:hypothetical protein